MSVMKPKFSLFKNIGYAIEGMRNMYKEETSFRIQLITFIIFSLILPFVSISLLSKLILFTAMLFVLAGEAINSAIERIVDLVSPDFHPLAKQAKDIGAFVVLLFFCINCMIWVVVLLWEFGVI